MPPPLLHRVAITSVQDVSVNYYPAIAKTLESAKCRLSIWMSRDGGARHYNAEMGDRLATIGMGRKWGGAAVGLGLHWVPI